jgi:hypothetical protein
VTSRLSRHPCLLASFEHERDDVRADISVSADGHNELRRVRRRMTSRNALIGDQIDFLVGTGCR